MLLTIRHETVYRYTAPLTYTIQQLRLTPRTEAHQHILSWQLATPGKCHATKDAFGNTCHMLTIAGMHHGVSLVARGEVRVDPLDQGRLRSADTLSPLMFAVPTRLTADTPAVADFARRHLRPNASSAELLTLAGRIQEAVEYQRGYTGVGSTASEALELGKGVCQDHAHLFLASCHVHGIPARYVSGYMDPGDTHHAESHAWIDVWAQDADFSGWVSIDVTHARHTGDTYCRLAIGRDYESVAPVRGVRQGGGMESLTVHVDVATREDPLPTDR